MAFERMDKQPLTKPAEQMSVKTCQNATSQKGRRQSLNPFSKDFFYTNAVCVFINEVLSTSPSPFGQKTPQSFYGNSILPADAEGTKTLLVALCSRHTADPLGRRKKKNRQSVRSHLTPTVNNCHVLLECASPFQEIIKTKIIFLSAFQDSQLFSAAKTKLLIALQESVAICTHNLTTGNWMKLIYDDYRS